MVLIFERTGDHSCSCQIELYHILQTWSASVQTIAPDCLFCCLQCPSPTSSSGLRNLFPHSSFPSPVPRRDLSLLCSPTALYLSFSQRISYSPSPTITLWQRQKKQAIAGSSSALRQTWIRNLALPLTGCVILGKSLHLSEHLISKTELR